MQPEAARLDRFAAPGVVALLAVMVLGVLVFSSVTRDDTTTEVQAGATVEQAPPSGETTGETTGEGAGEAWVPDRPGDYVTFDGSAPPSSPPVPLALGPFALDGPFSVASDFLGPADEIVSDLGGWLHQWELPGDALVGVTMWEDDTFQIAGLHVTVPEGSQTRVAMAGGAVLGESSVAEIFEAIGVEAQPATHPQDDFVAMTVQCRGPFPVVVKLDAPGSLPAPGMLDRQATSALMGYADAAPGEPPCD